MVVRGGGELNRCWAGRTGTAGPTCAKALVQKGSKGVFHSLHQIVCVDVPLLKAVEGFVCGCLRGAGLHLV